MSRAAIASSASADAALWAAVGGMASLEITSIGSTSTA
jgi:hypothetical protein